MPPWSPGLTLTSNMLFQTISKGVLDGHAA